MTTGNWGTERPKAFWVVARPKHWLREACLPRSAKVNNLSHNFNTMKVAYVFSSSGQTVDYVLGDMVLPQLEHGEHMVDVAGMVSFSTITHTRFGLATH